MQKTCESDPRASEIDRESLSVVLCRARGSPPIFTYAGLTFRSIKRLVSVGRDET